MKSKYFYFKKPYKEFSSIRWVTPKNLSEAFDKTLEKWVLILKGYNKGHEDFHRECGLCNLYYMDACTGCPVMRYTGQRYCAGTKIAGLMEEKDKEQTYLFMLLLKEVIKDDKKYNFE